VVGLRFLDHVLYGRGSILTRLLSLIILIILAGSCAGPSRRTSQTMPYEDRLQLASIYIQSNQIQKAVPLLEKAAAQDAGRPEAHAMLGEILFIQGDLEGSTRHLSKALEVGGDDPPVLNNLAWIELNQGRPDKALGLIDRALRFDPMPVYPYLDTRSRILLALGRHTEALTDARTALRQVPDHDGQMREQLKELIRTLEDSIHGPEEKGY
jgi:Tfp pilus assembly protein PilF